MAKPDRSPAVPVLAVHRSFRDPAQRIWRLVGVWILVVAVSWASAPASAMRIRPLHDRVLVERQIVEARNTAGIVVPILFLASIQVDPHGVAHGVIRIDTGNGEPKTFGVVEALVARGDDGAAGELLILISPHIVRSPADTSMVQVHRDAVDADLLHWILFDRAGNQLTFSAPGIIQTLPPANGPR